MTLSKHCPAVRLSRESRYTRCLYGLSWARSSGIQSGQLVPRFTESKLSSPAASLVACLIVSHFFSVLSQIFMIHPRSLSLVMRVCWGMPSLVIDGSDKSGQMMTNICVAKVLMTKSSRQPQPEPQPQPQPQPQSLSSHSYEETN